MTDEADLASAREEQHNAAALVRFQAKAERFAEAGPLECDDCGAEIPEARRAAVPGTRYCVDCQNDREREALGWSRR